MEFKVKGSDMKKKTVTKTGDGGHVFVPKTWIGKEAVVILLEE